MIEWADLAGHPVCAELPPIHAAFSVQFAV